MVLSFVNLLIPNGMDFQGYLRAVAEMVAKILQKS